MKLRLGNKIYSICAQHHSTQLKSTFGERTN